MCAFTYDTLFAVVGMAFGETVVFQIVVGNAYGGIHKHIKKLYMSVAKS